MSYQNNGANEFGSGYNWEDGAYPDPPDPIRKKVDGENKKEIAPIQPKKEHYQKDTDEGGVNTDTYRGIVIDVVSPHTLIAGGDNEDDEIEIGTLFLGNGSDWLRVSCWGDASNKVEQYQNDDQIVLEVTGVVAENDSEITDILVFDDDETSLTEINEEIRFTPEPAEMDSLGIESLVTVAEAKTIVSYTATHESNGGNKFKVKHLAAEINGEKFVIELHDSHINCPAEMDDNLLILVGWTKNLEDFRYHQLPDLEYSGKLWVRNYSGLRNLSKNPLPS